MMEKMEHVSLSDVLNGKNYIWVIEFTKRGMRE